MLPVRGHLRRRAVERAQSPGGPAGRGIMPRASTYRSLSSVERHSRRLKRRTRKQDPEALLFAGRRSTNDPTPTYLGYSTGKWEGDTLVVDTMGFNDRTWLDAAGHGHGEKLHVIERFTRSDSNTLRVEATIEDPDYYTKPWTVVTFATWYANQEVMEYICQENNRDLKHLVGK